MNLSILCQSALEFTIHDLNHLLSQHCLTEAMYQGRNRLLQPLVVPYRNMHQYVALLRGCGGVRSSAWECAAHDAAQVFQHLEGEIDDMSCQRREQINRREQEMHVPQSLCLVIC
jgi:hypothetical protein